MDEATIGDDTRPLYEFEWDDHSRTTDEIGDLDEAGFEATLEDVIDEAHDDPECDVRIIGFE
jgi:hypothetical protein